LALPPAARWAQAAAQPSFGATLLQMLLGLAGVLVLLVGSLWLLKRLTAVRGSGPVGGRERVVIVEVGSTWLVLGVAPGRVSALAEIPRQAACREPLAGPAPAGMPALAATLYHRES
jgi:flagellar protein FliO/FliZ